jgi:hypothetical protein
MELTYVIRFFICCSIIDVRYSIFVGRFAMNGFRKTVNDGRLKVND